MESGFGVYGLGFRVDGNPKPKSELTLNSWGSKWSWSSVPRCKIRCLNLSGVQGDGMWPRLRAYRVAGVPVGAHINNEQFKSLPQTLNPHKTYEVYYNKRCKIVSSHDPG